MKKTLFIIIAASAAGVMVVSFWAYRRYFRNETAEMLIFQVERGDIQEKIAVRGEVAPRQEYDLEFPFSGTVEEVLVNEGDRVSAGQELMRLETTDDELEIQRLNAELKQAQANISSAQAQLQKYEAAVEGERVRLQEMERGTRQEEIAVSQKKVENARIALDDALMNLQNVTAKAQADLQSDYDAAWTSVRQAVVKAKTALLTISRIQQDYFLGSSLEEAQLASALAQAVKILLGKETNGRWATQYLSELDGGVYGTVLEASSPSFSDIENFLTQTLQALRSVSAALDAVPFSTSLTASDRSDIETQKSTIVAESAVLSSRRQAIEVQKSENQKAEFSARTAVNEARGALQLAQEELNLKLAGYTAEQIEEQKTRVRQAEAQIASQKAAIEQYQAEIVSILAQRESAQERVRKAVLTAPVDSQVVEIYFEAGEIFRPGTSAVTLYAFGFQVQADISELDIGKIHAGNDQEVIIVLDAFEGETFEGAVTSIDPREVFKDDDRYFRVNFSIDAGDIPIRAGMSADITIFTRKKEGVLKIPEFAIYERGGKRFVKVLDGKNLYEREIITGLSDGEYREVVQGLQEGQQVVVVSE